MTDRDYDPGHHVDPREAEEAVPHSLEAEQAVLGAVLFDNAVLADVDGIIHAEAFHEPFHQRLFAAMYEIVGAGLLAEPTRLAQRFEHDPAFGEFGGARFLYDLLDKAPPSSAAADFARVVREAYQRREIIRSATELLRRARVDRDVDSLDLIEVAERDLLAIQTQSRVTALVTAEAAVARVLEELENPASAAGVAMGLPPLDAEIGGMMPGELWILAGRPSMGKSAIANGTALHVARHGVHPDGRRLGWIEINGEMTVAQMMRRHIADLAFELAPRDAPSYSKIRKRLLTPAERGVLHAAATEIRQLPTLVSVKRTGMTLGALRSMVRRQAAAWDRMGIALGGVSIDHGGLIRVEDSRRSRTEAQTEVAIGMKELADELGVPLMVLLQLNRQVEQRDDKRPLLADLRDSGAWEENADGVIGVYRDAYYAERETEPKSADRRALWEARKSSRIVEALLLKIREGQAGVVELWADMARNAIRGSAPDNLYGGSMGFAWESLDASIAASAAPYTGPAGDPRPEPPPAAYDAEEFA